MPFLVSYESSNGSDPDQKSSFRDHRLAVWDSPDTTAGSAIEFGWLTGENRGGWLGVEGEPPVLSEFQRPQAIRIGGCSMKYPKLFMIPSWMSPLDRGFRNIQFLSSR